MEPVLYTVSSLTILILAVYVWRHQHVHGARPFALACFCAAGWSFSHVLGLLVTNSVIHLIADQLRLIFLAGASVAWLIFVIQYTGNGKWLSYRHLALLAIIPLMMMALGLTSNLYGPAASFASSYNLWHWMQVGYSLLIAVTSMYMLLGMITNTPAFFHAQTVILLIGVICPLGWLIFYQFGIVSMSLPDLTPYLLILSVGVIFLGLFRYRLLDLAPLQYGSTMSDLDDAIIVTDVYQRIVNMNPASELILNQKATDAVGQPLADLFRGWQGLPSEQPAAETNNNTPQFVNPATGHFYEARRSTLTGRHGNCIGYLIVLLDITERRAADDLLRKYEGEDKQRQIGQEPPKDQRGAAILQERTRLAHELHDTIGQVLGYVRLQAHTTRQLLSRGQIAEADAQLNRLIEVAETSQAEVRDQILGLGVRPLLNGQASGLAPALRNYIDALASRSRTRLTFSADPELLQIEMEPEAEAQVIRIVQEAVANANKHGGSQHVQVLLTLDGNCLHGVVEDDGNGFTPGAIPDTGARKFGLRIMAERAEEIGGRLQILSAPGQGTKVIFDIPCTHRERGQTTGPVDKKSSESISASLQSTMPT